MVKRLIIVFPLLVAFSLLQAHNLVAHHHENESIAHHEHEDGDNDHSPFNDLNHNSDFGKAVSGPKALKNIIEKPCFVAAIFVVLYNNLSAFESLPRYQPPDDDFSSPLNSLPGYVPLRAPPASSKLS